LIRYLKKKDLINELKNKNLNINEMCSEILENKELIHELNAKMKARFSVSKKALILE